MMVARPDSFWKEHTWTDDEEQFKHWPAGTANVPDELVPRHTNRTPILPVMAPAYPRFQATQGVAKAGKRRYINQQVARCK